MTVRNRTAATPTEDPLSLGLRAQPWIWMAFAAAFLVLDNDALFIGALLMGRLAAMENIARRAYIETLQAVRDVLRTRAE